MSDNALQKLIRKTGEAHLKNSTGSPALVNTKLSGETQEIPMLFIWVPLIILAFELSLLASRFENSWVVLSPLFNIVGAVGCFLLLALSMLTGAIWWFITGSKDILNWVFSVPLFGSQPYRASVGLFFVLMICVSLCIGFLKWLKIA